MLGSKQLTGLLCSKPQCLLQVTAKATICHKSELEPKNVYHWPYERKSWGIISGLLDPFTKKKITENSKIIIVEGNINCGKEDFAKRLANELGMHYAPPIDLESHFFTDYGYDYRALNPMLPERMRACDWKMFHECPTRHSVIHMLQIVYKLRLAQYVKALQHLFNTGQGVVLNRSVFTDRVFPESMHNLGWLPLGYLRGDGIRFYDWILRYRFQRERSACYLAKPHLAIYLDMPVDKCMERIKNSSDPMEANSKALTPEFLEGIQEAYENIMLPKLEHNGHVLKYKVEGRMTDDELFDVIDDIKELDFEYDWHDTKFADWNDKQHKLWYRRQRLRYTTGHIFQAFASINQNWYDIAGMGDSITHKDIIMRNSFFEAQLGGVGYHSDFDTDIKQQGALKALFDPQSFGRIFQLYVRTDYL